MKVTLLTKADCGLCREAEEILRGLRMRFTFELEAVDIEDDAALCDRYWDRVPVVLVDGREAASAPLDEAAVTAVLRAQVAVDSGL